MFKSIAIAMAAVAALAIAGPAGATIVNLDGHANTSTDGSTARFLSIVAGTYKVTFTQDDYTAFSRWSGNSQCDAFGANCRQGWENSVAIAIGSTSGPMVFFLGDANAHGNYGPATGGGYFDTAAHSFAHSSNYSQVFTLSAPTNVYFTILDNALGDNRGGISLSVVRVPEPAGWPLLVVGVGMIGMLYVRRRKTAPNSAS